MMSTLSTLLLAGVVASVPVLQEGPPAQPPGPPPEAPDSSPLFKLAQRLGRAAGNADYCGVEERQVESFISNAMARLAGETDDRVLLAGSRVQFNAHAAYGRSEGPDGDCESFEPNFQRLARNLESESPDGLSGGEMSPDSRFIR